MELFLSHGSMNSTAQHLACNSGLVADMSSLSPPPAVAGVPEAKEATTSACAPRRSMEDMSPPRRPDTPQLTLHGYRKFQQSPLLVASPVPEYSKRVRRKASIADLTRTSLHAAALWTPNPPSPAPIHSLDRGELFTSFLPPPPTTPQPQQQHHHHHHHHHPPPPPPFASPSLSSTVDTLQSTPTHTPVYHLDHHHSLSQQAGLVEPIRTKRKFSPLRPAKRLPHPADGSSGSSSGGPEGGLYEVYAAVFDPLEEQRRAGTSPSSRQRVRLPRQQSLAERVEVKQSGQRRITDYTQGLGIDTDDGLDITDAADNVPFHQEKEAAATSTFSLSRFEFPVPPGHDNWGTSAGHLVDYSTPSSPATLHLHGTSFDLVNPHASLILGSHRFETPAEIDGLLDDYFHQQTEAEKNMPDTKLDTKPSQASLAASSDSARYARVLYQDANSARRNILHVEDNLPAPPPVLISNPQLAHKSSSTLNIPKAFVGPAHAVAAPHANPTAESLSYVPSVASLIDCITPDDAYEALPANVQEEAPQHLEASKPPTFLSKKASVLKKTLSRKGKKLKKNYRSDPFDLTLSDNGGCTDISTIDDRVKQGPRLENEAVSKGHDDQISSELSGQGDTSHADVNNQETDTAVRDILNGYDYTREDHVSADESVFLHSPSIEKGFGVESVDKHDSAHASILLSPGASPKDPFADGTYAARENSSATVLEPPTPPAPVYNGTWCRYWDGCTDLPTSEQTYGETNQLLNVTPEYARLKGHINNSVQYINVPKDQASTRLSKCGSVYDENDVDNSPPSPSLEQARAYAVNPTPQPSEPDHALGCGLSNYDLDQTCSQMRSPSFYFDDSESAWETQYTPSRTNLAHGDDRNSEDSYANTSIYDEGSHRFSMISEKFSNSPLAHVQAKEVPPSHASPQEAKEAADDQEALSQANKRMTMLLKDKILNENLDYYHCWGAKWDKDERKNDLAELERLRAEYPSGFRVAAGDFIREAEKRLSLVKPESLAKLQKPFGKGKSRVQYDPQKSFNKASALGISMRGAGAGADPASDRRRLLQSTPSLGQGKRMLSWSDSVDTMVTFGSHLASPQQRYGATPEVWSPFCKDATSRVLDSHNPASPYHTGRDRAAQSTSDRLTRGGRAAVNSQKGMHEMQLLKPATGGGSVGRGLSDAELIKRSESWQLEPNLTASGALGRYALGNEVRCEGPLSPRLAREALAHGHHINGAEDMRAQVKRASEQYAALCLFPFVFVGVLLGSGDRHVQKATKDCTQRMDAQEKKLALYVYTPLGFFLWGLIVWWIWFIVGLAQQKGPIGE